MTNKFFLILLLFLQIQKVEAEFNFKIIKPAVLSAACLISAINFMNYANLNFNHCKKEINLLTENWNSDLPKQKIGKIINPILHATLSLTEFSISLVFLVPGLCYFEETINQIFPKPTFNDMIYNIIFKKRK